jgi:hypothetical protein
VIVTVPASFNYDDEDTAPQLLRNCWRACDIRNRLKGDATHVFFGNSTIIVFDGALSRRPVSEEQVIAGGAASRSQRPCSSSCLNSKPTYGRSRAQLMGYASAEVDDVVLPSAPEQTRSP